MVTTSLFNLLPHPDGKCYISDIDTALGNFSFSEVRQFWTSKFLQFGVPLLISQLILALTSLRWQLYLLFMKTLICEYYYWKKIRIIELLSMWVRQVATLYFKQIVYIEYGFHWCCSSAFRGKKSGVATRFGYEDSVWIFRTSFQIGRAVSNTILKRILYP